MGGQVWATDARGHPSEPDRALYRNEFGTAVWPHLFRDCLLTSLAVDQPELMRISATLLGHQSSITGEKHYNQARMLDASRRFGRTVSEIRQALLSGTRGCEDGSDK